MYVRHLSTIMRCVGRDKKNGTKVLSSIQPADDVHCGKNIYLVDQNAKETPLKILEGQQTDMKLIKLSMRLPPMKEVGCASNFVRKVVMQTRQINKLNAMSKVYLKHFPSFLNYDLLLSWQRHKGRFKILKQINRRAYKLKLATILKVNSMFNMGVSKGYQLS